MARKMLPIALAAATTLSPLSALAEGKFSLKSVNVDLPTSDRLFPDGPGSDAVNNNCLACHSAGMVLEQPTLSKAQWHAEVEKMITAYKAPIDPADVDAIVGYLVSIQGAK
jgi:cytochrome c5